VSKSDKQHRWLSQVEVTGVVFSEPVLNEAAPAGFPSLDKQTLARFYRAREIWNLPKGMLRDNGDSDWIGFILEEILRIQRPTDWLIGAAIPAPLAVSLPEHQETLRPTRVLVDGGRPLLLFLAVPRSQSLDRTWMHSSGRWKASPTTKLERMLRQSQVELGLVTNGEAWRLLVCSPSETASWLTWTAQGWAETPVTLAAFRDLLGEERFFAGELKNTCIELVRRSRERQLDVADELGNQVREALRLLVHELDRVDAECDGHLFSHCTDADVFEASVAFIMRVIFLFYAEENDLLPHGQVAYDQSYGVIHLLRDLEHQYCLSPQKLDQSFSAYAQLLGTFRLIHAGSPDPDLSIVAYGGALFDPDRYLLLEGRVRVSSCTPDPPPVKDSVVRRILRSLKYASINGGKHIVSYRSLAVEQIGHLYEGLLDRCVCTAPLDGRLFLLQGSSKCPEPDPLPESKIQGLARPDLVKLLQNWTGRTKKSVEDQIEKHLSPGQGAPEKRLFPNVAVAIDSFLIFEGVVRPGGRYVKNGGDRKAQGAHYTPPSLTEPIVRHTLEHLVYLDAQRRHVKNPEEILDVKICDPAMGSGAFLVQAARYLAERLVDSWEVRAASYSGDLPLTMPLARLSQGLTEEILLPETREDRLVWARRYVAERSIYGVDLNRHAVEVAKLSMWVFTLSINQPFTFLDHALKHGDSLVGLTKEQIRSFSWKSQREPKDLLLQGLDSSVVIAETFRTEIHKDIEQNYSDKKIRLEKADLAVATLRLAGNLTLAAYFGYSRNDEREVTVKLFRRQLEDSLTDANLLVQLKDRVGSLGAGTTTIFPFHWELEFPEIFDRDNPGFDAIVGNPPFLGGRRLTAVIGESYRDWLAELHEGSSGNADLCAHFFRRAHSLVRQEGYWGLLATKTIAQGDTRTTGLYWISRSGGTLFRAVRRKRWPGEASVIVSLIHGKKGPFEGSIYLDGRAVPEITAFLFHTGGSEDPQVLDENLGQSFQGSIPLGMGFTFDDTDEDGIASPVAEMHRLVASDPRNAEVIFPYIGGAEVNDSPTHKHHRFVINFGQLTEAEARRWPDIMSIVERQVRPSRATQKRAHLRERWWQHAETRPAMYAAIRNLSRVLVTPQNGKHRSFVFLPQQLNYDQTLIVLASEKFAEFSILQSSVHEDWSKFFGGTLGVVDTPRYLPRKCFETFPFPPSWNTMVSLEEVGKAYYEHRVKVMQSAGEGLTRLYNRFHDSNAEQWPEICELRSLHVKLDRCVLDAYGWTDIRPRYEYFSDNDIEEFSSKSAASGLFRWSEDDRDEVLARLLSLNKSRFEGQ
jgi:hypothetical protein